MRNRNRRPYAISTGMASPRELKSYQKLVPVEDATDPEPRVMVVIDETVALTLDEFLDYVEQELDLVNVNELLLSKFYEIILDRTIPGIEQAMLVLHSTCEDYLRRYNHRRGEVYERN